MPSNLFLPITFYIALSRGIAPQELGLAGPDKAAYLQCLDPRQITGGGTVIFKIKKMNEEKKPSGRLKLSSLSSSMKLSSRLRLRQK